MATSEQPEDSERAEPSQLTTLPADFGILSPTVAMAIGNMTPDQRDIFDYEYRKKKRSLGAMMALAILFPIQFFFLDKTGLGIAFLLTWGFVGIGWIVFMFLTPGMVREYNDAKANEVIRNIRYATQRN